MKTTYKTICWLAVIGVTVSAACLSFGGIFALPAASALFLLCRRETAAKLSSFFSAAIEGTIYKQNADAAINFSLNHSIAKRLLKILAKTPPHSSLTNEFLKDYTNQTKYLHQLEENLDHFKFHFAGQESDKEIAEREITTVKKRLEMMETLFLTRLLNPKLHLTDSIRKPIDELLRTASFINKEDIEKELQNKGWQLFFSKIASLGAGICCTLVTLGSFHTNLLTMGYKFASILLIGGSIISGLAGVGYFLLMYRTLSYLIQSEMVKKWYKKAKDFYNKKNKNCWDYLKAFALCLFVTIAIVGTIATAGTWLYLGTFGVAFLSSVSPALATCVSLSTWACMLAPSLLYNVLNTVKSLYKIPQMFRGFCRKTAHDIKQTWDNENIFQLLNPFRLLMKMSKIIIFIGHILSTGAASASEKNPFISSTELAIIANATTEGATDLHQIIDSHDHAEEKEKSDCSSNNHNHNHGHGHGHHNHDHESNTAQNEEDEEDDHHHHGGIILDQVEGLLKGLATAWDFAAGNWFGFRRIYKYCVGQSNNYIIEEAIDKFYSPEKLPEVPRLSEAWARHEVDEKFGKEVAYYQEKKIKNKEEAFSTLKTTLTLEIETKTPKKESSIGLLEEKVPSDFFDTLSKTLPDNPAKNKKADSPLSDNPYILFHHRNPLSRKLSSSLPRSGEFIEGLRLDRSFNLRGG